MKVRQNSRGFTLVEMIVAVALFAIVMVICVATLLALVNANRKAQSLQAVMNDLNVALDGMARAIRQGDEFYCGTPVGVTGTQNCQSGATAFTFEHYGGSGSNFNDQWVYQFFCPSGFTAPGTCPDGGYIGRSVAAGASSTFFPITSPEVKITYMQFFVTGAIPNEDPPFQPTVTMVILGTAGGVNVKTKTDFHIEATAVQRRIDL